MNRKASAGKSRAAGRASLSVAGFALAAGLVFTPSAAHASDSFRVSGGGATQRECTQNLDASMRRNIAAGYTSIRGGVCKKQGNWWSGYTWRYNYTASKP